MRNQVRDFLVEVEKSLHGLLRNIRPMSHGATLFVGTEESILESQYLSRKVRDQPSSRRSCYESTPGSTRLCRCNVEVVGGIADSNVAAEPHDGQQTRRGQIPCRGSRPRRRPTPDGSNGTSPIANRSAAARLRPRWSRGDQSSRIGSALVHGRWRTVGQFISTLSAVTESSGAW